LKKGREKISLTRSMLDDSAYLFEPVSQECLFISVGNPPRRISSEAARWCEQNRSVFHQDEASYDSDCDGGLQYYMRGIVGDAMQARLAVKFKLLQDATVLPDVGGIVDDAMLAVTFKLLHTRRLVVRDTVLRRASAPGMVGKRIEEGSQEHYPLQRAQSCADQASSSEEESQAFSLPAIEIDAGFFKLHAQRIKKQREMLRGSIGL
jgi:hypothetical protein